MMRLEVEMTNEEVKAIAASRLTTCLDTGLRNSLQTAADDPRDPAAMTYSAWRRILTPIFAHAKMLLTPTARN
jgi:hypothetical protein